MFLDNTPFRRSVSRISILADFELEEKLAEARRNAENVRKRVAAAKAYLALYFFPPCMLYIFALVKLWFLAIHT